MVGFLEGLGAFGAGIAPGISALADQQSNNDFGNALASIYGGQTQPQQQSPLQSLLSGIGLGGQQQSAPTPMPAQQQTPQAQFPQLAQAPQPRAFTPPQPVPTQTSSPIGGVAQPSGGLPQQAQQPPQAPQQPPQAPQQPQAQPQARPQAQPQQQVGNGPLDLPTLVKHLVAQGVTGHRLGSAVQRFIPLLNAQGLQQYRDLGLQLRAENLRDLEANREWNRNPNAPGSAAQSRVANQGIAVQRMEGINERFKARMQAALDKLKNAKTDKEAIQAKTDLDKVASDLKQELQAELNIVNTPGASPEEQKAALAKAAEIRQQLQDATDEAVKARRTGASKEAKDSNQNPVVYTPDGKAVRWNGKGDSTDPDNYEPVDGGQ